MALKRAVLVPAAMAALLAAASWGCASSEAGADQDGGSHDGGQTDRAPQQDAPPFNDDAALQEDASVDDGPVDDGAAQDAQHDAAQQDAQHDAAQQDASTCTPEADEALGGDTCANAIDKGTLSDVASTHVALKGNLWPAGDVDWYKFVFLDTSDDVSLCDKFDARVNFTATGNPGGRYAFDVLVDLAADQLCQPPAAGFCQGTGESNLGLTAFKWDASGQCPCSAPGNLTADVPPCTDNSMIVRIRVYRVSGAAVCEEYELTVDNGPVVDGGV